MAVVAKAQKISGEERRGWADYQAEKTAGLTARSITRWLGRTFKRMFKGVI